MLSNRHLEHLVSYNYGASLVYKLRKNVPWHQFFEAIHAEFVRSTKSSIYQKLTFGCCLIFKFVTFRLYTWQL